MFRIESYITPFLMSYLDRYVKLRHEDFQLSLWGGAAVLTKLDLRLDAIERQLQLPVSLKSGHIQELKIQVPWTKLGSEPVVVTISTIECIVTLCGSSDASDDKSSTSSSTRDSTAKMPRNRSRRKLPAGSADEEAPPPGYIQSLLNRIVNNINVIVDNLILKFVEEDIVLSLNVKSAELFSVNSEWQRAFVDVALPDLILRRLLKLSDLTVCLDRRDASGRVETYQDPVLYRCSLSVRMFMRHSNLHSSAPSLVRLHALCDRLDLSLTDVQLPMAARLIELALALYYGEYDLASSGKTPAATTTATTDTASKEVNVPAAALGPKDVANTEGFDEVTGATDATAQGNWVSWAWSYVPRLLPGSAPEAMAAESADDQEGSSDDTEPSIFDLAFYVRQASLVFKLSKLAHGVGTAFGGAFQRITFEPYMELDFTGVAMEILIRGMLFMDVQLGVTHLAARALGSCVCGYSSAEAEAPAEPDFLLLGTTHDKPFNYLTGSLFDASRHHSAVAAYIFDLTKHYEKFTESWTLDRFGAAWINYLWLEEQRSSAVLPSDGISLDSADDSIAFSREVSHMKFWFGSATVNVTSSTRHHWSSLMYDIKNHEYEPYAKPRQERPVDTAPLPETVVERLREFIPVKNLHLALVSLTVNLYASDHQDYDVTHEKHGIEKDSRRKKVPCSILKNTELPWKAVYLQLSADRFDLRTMAPMYPYKVVRLVSRIRHPPEDLMHFCTYHMSCEARALSLRLASMPNGGTMPRESSPIVLPCSLIFNRRTLLHPSYWKDNTTELSQMTFSMKNIVTETTMAQIYLITKLMRSLSKAEVSKDLVKTTLVDDAVIMYGGRRPTFSIALGELDLKRSTCLRTTSYSGTLDTLVLSAVTRDDAGNESETAPIFFAPSDTAEVPKCEFFSSAVPPPTASSQDFVSFTCEIPQGQPDSDLASFVFRCEASGVAINVDPILIEFYDYKPSFVGPDAVEQTSNLDCRLVLDPKLVDSSSPLIVQGKSGSSACSSDGRSMSRKPSTMGSRGVSRPAGGGGGAGSSSSVAECKMPPSSFTQEDSDTRQIEQASTPSSTWQDVSYRLYLIFRSLDIHVSIGHCVIFGLAQHVPFGRRSHFGNMLDGWHDIYRSGRTRVPVLVMVLPTVAVHNGVRKAAGSHSDVAGAATFVGGHGNALTATAPSTSSSNIGGSVPVTVEMSSAAVYTLDSRRSKPVYLLQPASATLTLAITAKEHQHGQQHELPSSVAVCAHCDMQSVALAVSDAQITAMCDVAGTWSAFAMALTRDAAEDGDRQREYTPESQGTAQKAHLVPQGLDNDASTSGIYIGDRRSRAARTHLLVVRSTAALPAAAAGGMLEGTIRTSASFWLQLAVPRLTVEMNVADQAGEEDIRVVSTLEEWTSSLDIQDVYWKLSTKMWAMDVSHFRRRLKDGDFGAWSEGPHGGILLACARRRLGRVDVLVGAANEVHDGPAPTMPSSRPHTSGLPRNMWTPFAEQSPTPQQHQFGPSSHQQAQHGFLQAVFTRALAENVAQRLQRFEGVSADDGQESTTTSWSCNKDVPLSPASNAAGSRSLRSGDCITEVCLDLQPFDVVLHVPTLSCVLHGFSNAWNKSSCSVRRENSDFDGDSESSPASADGCDDAATPVEQHLPRSAHKPWLVHLFAYDPRFLFPINVPGVAECQTSDNDVAIIVMAQSVGLSSQTENPLPRLVLHPELYRKKQKLMDVPGSDVEDRQYQLDFRGCCVTAGQFSKLLIKDMTLDNGIISENPALAWNSQRIPRQNVPQLLHPIIAPFDLRAVYAPAVFCDEVVMCGHSLEINLIRPMVVTFSSCHLHVVESLISSASPLMRKSSTTTGEALVKQSRKPTKDVLATVAAMVPFDILFTTSKVTLMITVRERLLSESVDDAWWEPVVCISLVQPHIFATTKPGHEHLQLSVYDVSLNGCSSNDSPVIGGRLPDMRDFPRKIMETKPGSPNVKTGIHPPFLTLSIRKILARDDARLTLVLDRPVRLTFSGSEIATMRRKLSFFILRMEDVRRESTTPSSFHDDKPIPSDRAKLLLRSPVSAITVKTEQLVLEYSIADVVDSGPECVGTPSGISASLSNCACDLTFVQFQSTVCECVSQATCHSEIKNMQLHTRRPHSKREVAVTGGASDESCAAAVGPFNFYFDMHARSHPHSGAAATPQLVASCRLSPVPLRISQETVVCLNAVAESVIRLSKSDDPRRGQSTRPSTQAVGRSASVVQVRYENSTTKSVDDLRMGSLQYVLPETGHERAKPNTVALLNEQDHGALSWCYSEPRLLEAIHVNPIPFDYCYDDGGIRGAHTDVGDLSAFHLSSASHRRGASASGALRCALELPCQLQYWDELEGAYVDYASFSVSEHRGTDVTLYDSASELAIAATCWRMLILYATLEEQTQHDDSHSLPGRHRIKVLALPSVLLAATKVNSCFIPYIIPAVQVAVSCEAVQLVLSSKRIFKTISKKSGHASLAPFVLEASFLETTSELELLRVDMSAVSTMASSWGQDYTVASAGGDGAAKLEVFTNISFSTLDNCYLTWNPVLHETDVDVSAELVKVAESDERTIRGQLTVGPAYMTVSQGTIHSLLTLAEGWSASFKGEEAEEVFSSNPAVGAAYSVCNNTQFPVIFGQVDTDEVLRLEPGTYCSYTWRAGKPGGNEQLHLCLEIDGHRTYWSETISVDICGTSFVLVKAPDATEKAVAIEVRQLSTLHMQVIFSGTLLVASRLRETVVEVLIAESASVKRQVVLDEAVKFTSHVCSVTAYPGVHLKVASEQSSWSENAMDKSARVLHGNSFPVKIAESPSGPVYVWCTVISTQIISNRQRAASLTCHLLLLTPLFTMRSYMPTSVVVNVLPSGHQCIVNSNSCYSEIMHSGNVLSKEQLPTLMISLQTSVDEEPCLPLFISADKLLQTKETSYGDSSLTESTIETCIQCYVNEMPSTNWNTILSKLCEKKLIGSFRPLVLNGGDLYENATPSLSTLANYTGDTSSRKAPNLDVDLGWRWHWQGLNTTVLVDVRPKILFASRCTLDVLVAILGPGGDVTSHLQLPAHGFTVPTGTIEHGFRIGVSGPLAAVDDVGFSSTVYLSNEGYTTRSAANSAGSATDLHVDSYCCVAIIRPLRFGSETAAMQAIHLTLRSYHYEGVRVIVVTERFVVANNTGSVVNVRLATVPVLRGSTDLGTATVESVRLEPTSARPWSLTAVLCGPTDDRRSSIGAGRSDDDDGNDAVSAELLVSLRSSVDGDWSHPVRVEVADSIRQHYLALARPMDVASKNIGYGSLVLSCHSHSGVQYLALSEQPSPPIVLHNESHCAMQYGEAVSSSGGSGGVAEQRAWAPLYSRLAVLPPRSFVAYAFPSMLSSYPSVAKGRPAQRLRIAAAHVAEDLQAAAVDDPWSSPIDVEATHVTFALMPGMPTDAKVTTHREGHTLHVHIDLVSRAEIVSRVQLTCDSGSSSGFAAGRKKEAVLLAGCPTSALRPAALSIAEQSTGGDGTVASPTSCIRSESAACEAADELRASGESRSSLTAVRSEEQSLRLELHAAIEAVSLVLLDECVVPGHVAEFLRVTADHLRVRLHLPAAVSTQAPFVTSQSSLGLVSPHAPRTPPSSPTVSDPPPRHGSLAVGLGGLQIDNQMYSRGSFDFAVVLWTQQPSDELSEVLRSGTFDECIDRDAFATLAEADLLLRVGRSGMLARSIVDTLSLRVRPMHFQLEDVFLQHLMRKMESFTRVLTAFVHTPVVHTEAPGGSILVGSDERELQLTVPRQVLLESREISSPLRLRSLVIHPCELFVSVHASVKLFIATDNAPLRFAAFSCTDVFSSPAYLLRAIATHYATGALFRAGWLVGSLDLIGNPAGLFRSFASGVTDLVYLPYSGLRQGPSSFVGGVGSGLSSAVRHIAAGTLTSITNFAQSLSRNMDRLSLDREHTQRQEINRRVKPERLSQGLVQGLTGLGLSLLGAVAGLADQPIRSLLTSPEEYKRAVAGSEASNAPTKPAQVPGNRAISLVTGISKGVIGMVTKPIGGTAEFISQTSQGLLHSIGMKSDPVPKSPAIVAHRLLDANYTRLKYLRKFRQLSTHGELLGMVRVQQLPHVTAATVLSGDEHDSLDSDIVLLLLPEVIFVVGALEDTLQQAFALTEIECCIRETEPAYDNAPTTFLQVALLNSLKSTLSEEEHITKNRVEEYVDSTSGYATKTADKEQSMLSLPMSHNFLTSTSGRTILHEYIVKDPSESAIFLAQFILAQRRCNGRGFS